MIESFNLKFIPDNLTAAYEKGQIEEIFYHDQWLNLPRWPQAGKEDFLCRSILSLYNQSITIYNFYDFACILLIFVSNL